MWDLNFILKDFSFINSRLFRPYGVNKNDHAKKSGSNIHSIKHFI